MEVVSFYIEQHHHERSGTATPPIAYLSNMSAVLHSGVFAFMMMCFLEHLISDYFLTGDVINNNV